MKQSTKDNLHTTLAVLHDFRSGLDFKDLTYTFKIFRPASWNAFGMDKEGSDYRACSTYGPIYK